MSKKKPNRRPADLPPCPARMELCLDSTELTCDLPRHESGNHHDPNFGPWEPDDTRVSVNKMALDEFIRYADSLRIEMDMEYGSNEEASKRDFDELVAKLGRNDG